MKSSQCRAIQNSWSVVLFQLSSNIKCTLNTDHKTVSRAENLSPQIYNHRQDNTAPTTFQGDAMPELRLSSQPKNIQKQDEICILSVHFVWFGVLNICYIYSVVCFIVVALVLFCCSK